MLMKGQLAPDFELEDTTGKKHHLSGYLGEKVVVLAFLRGFMWPYCRAQLARLRDGYEEFTKRDAEILAIGPDKRKKFENFWEENNIPFPGLPDPQKMVSKTYKQEINLFKLGRMPLNAVLDRKGYIRFIHYGYSMSDIPDNETLLDVIDELNASSK